MAAWPPAGFGGTSFGGRAELSCDWKGSDVTTTEYDTFVATTLLCSHGTGVWNFGVRPPRRPSRRCRHSRLGERGQEGDLLRSGAIHRVSNTHLASLEAKRG